MHNPGKPSPPDPRHRARSARFLLAVLLIAVLGACAPETHLTAPLDREAAPAQKPAPKTPAPPVATQVRAPVKRDPLPSAVALTVLESDEEMVSPAEPEQTISIEIRELAKLGDWKAALPLSGEEKVAYDFPVTMNSQVEFYLDFFQNELRGTFGRWLSRSGRYLPLMKKHLAEAGLPQDLAYLPMIESGYNLTAYSSAQAAGPWQFMQATGRSYGLTVDEYIDERRDPVKSTEAAVAYLSALYAKFDSWHLAVAAYNAGEGRIQRAMREVDSNDFWEIANGYYLPTETKLYVPKLIAAIMIAREPEKYGFADIPYQDPMEYETVLVPRWTSLQAVSVACGAALEEILDLNRQLRRAVTPPTMAEYPLRVPPGAGELVAENLPRVRKTVATQYKEHRVAKGESLSSVGRKYNLSKQVLLKTNKLRSEKLSPGQRLRIPHEVATYRLLSEEELARQVAVVTADDLILHRVRKGETAAAIAKRYDVSVRQLAAWNDLKDPSRIRVGQQLALYPDTPAIAQPATVATAGQVTVLEPRQVKTKGQETAQESGQSDATGQVTVLEPQQIKAKGQVPVEEPRQSEAMAQVTILEPTQSKKKASDGTPLRTARHTAPAYHLVREGETLWSIARKYQLSPNHIKLWNQLADDTIQTGRRLIIRSGSDLDA